jgi:hypothetical protein
MAAMCGVILLQISSFAASPISRKTRQTPADTVTDIRPYQHGSYAVTIGTVVYLLRRVTGAAAVALVKVKVKVVCIQLIKHHEVNTCG